MPLVKHRMLLDFFQQIKDEDRSSFFKNNRIEFDADKYLAKLGTTK